ncbi:MAG: zeta toxin family protein [Alphaproteobacteria bacterium]
MKDENPTIYMISGANGSGKTTTAMTLLPKFLSMYEFINADEIARGLNPLNPKGQAITAGKLMLNRIDSLMASKKSFAFETTCSSLTFFDKLKKAKEGGYTIGLIFLWLPSSDMAIERVKIRVSQGGHDIPKQDIIRRYKRGFVNLINHYLPIADKALIYNNVDPHSGKLIAKKEKNEIIVYNKEIWDNILKESEI